MKCKICGENGDDDGYCELHRRAYERIIRKYIVWKRALEISWQEYLREIINNPLTGEWPREVAQYLIKSGERENVAES